MRSRCMSPVYSRPIVCTACAGRDFDLFVFQTAEQIEAFRATPSDSRPEPGSHSSGENRVKLLPESDPRRDTYSGPVRIVHSSPLR
jgi:hypothetical protein